MNLSKLFGNSPRIKVMGTFLSNPEVGFNKSMISNLTGVSRQTLQELCKDLVRIGFIRKRGIHYTLRRYNPFVNALLKYKGEINVSNKNK